MGLKEQQADTVVLDDDNQDDEAHTTDVDEAGSGETKDTADTSHTDDENSDADDTAASDDEVVITLGDEKPNPEDDENQQDSAAIRQLRAANREKQQRLRELEQKLESITKQQQPQATAVGEKPTLDGCDYDTDKFEAELDAWKERKRQADAEQKQRTEAEENARKDWQAKLDTYAKRKTELKVKDFEEAEETFKTATSVTQQGVILSGSEDPALVVAFLGKNPKKLAEFAAIKDPVKFAFAVAKLETQLKVTPRKAAPIPEKVVRGSAPVTGSSDSQLERLRAEAEKSGDYTKVHQYRRQLKAKQQ
jgi:hypothetical protein